jgi:hypothetical protein
MSERPDERDEDRPEDREDVTDQAIKLAREHCIEAVQLLIDELQAKQAVTIEDRMKAAIALLEVAGCL